jgi:hypothetical protein
VLLSNAFGYASAMSAISDNDPQKSNTNAGQLARDSEIDGLIALGMKHEALRLARRNLHRDPITAQEFNDALNAILTLGDRTKPWAKAVEAAYERLPKRDRAFHGQHASRLPGLRPDATWSSERIIPVLETRATRLAGLSSPQGRGTDAGRQSR